MSTKTDTSSTKIYQSPEQKRMHQIIKGLKGQAIPPTDNSFVHNIQFTIKSIKHYLFNIRIDCHTTDKFSISSRVKHACVPYGYNHDLSVSINVSQSRNDTDIIKDITRRVLTPAVESNDTVLALIKGHKQKLADVKKTTDALLKLGFKSSKYSKNLTYTSDNYYISCQVNEFGRIWFERFDLQSGSDQVLASLKHVLKLDKKSKRS
jgi:hypothetical protein